MKNCVNSTTPNGRYTIHSSKPYEHVLGLFANNQKPISTYDSFTRFTQIPQKGKHHM